jgi:hypothetical protein
MLNNRIADDHIKRAIFEMYASAVTNNVANRPMTSSLFGEVHDRDLRQPCRVAPEELPRPTNIENSRSWFQIEQII